MLLFVIHETIFSSGQSIQLLKESVNLFRLDIKAKLKLLFLSISINILKLVSFIEFMLTTLRTPQNNFKFTVILNTGRESSPYRPSTL